ncbi:MAG: type IV secretion system DNA-binding domain-containing protein, partial [Candidatus Peregrinibacteria bacterium]|nr:type IV secretion system DNA-binding domain-containing protein [Candidatus Peregrinibacteria bacterium]
EKIPWYKRLLGLRGERVSLEIIHRKRHIRFLVSTPRRYKNLLEGQIYAHYPNVEIFEEEDYMNDQAQAMEIKEPVNSNEKTDNQALTTETKSVKERSEGNFKPLESKQVIVATEIYLDSPDPYPIKRYPQFEDRITRTSADPIAGITSAMVKLYHPNDQAWIQIAMVPLDDKWRIKYTELLRIVNKGLYANIEALQHIYLNVAGTRKMWPRVIFFPLYTLFWFRRKMSGLKSKGGGIVTLDTGGGGGYDDELEEVMSKTHDRETAMQAATDKVSKLMYEVNIRVAYLPANGDVEVAKLKVKEIAGSFKQFNQPLLNEFNLGKLETGDHLFEIFKHRMLRGDSMVLNVEELASIYHVPSHVVQTPNIDWVKSRKLEAPVDLPSPETVPADNLTLLGKTNYRGMHQVFGIKCNPDRRRHMYIIGKTGMGKTTLLENMIYSDIQSGKGIGVVDPHGDLAERVLDFVPPNRVNDVVIFDPSDREFPVSFNMLESADSSFDSIVCSGLVGIFKKIYAESWGPRLEHILRNVILSLLSYPDTTMLGITRILQDDDFKRRVVKKIEDPVVRGFWDGEFDKMSDKFKSEAISPILNKVGQFLSSPIIRNIVGQPKSSIDLRFMMDRGKIVIVNLSKGKLGEDNSSLLGAMMITKFQLDAMSRADIPEEDRKDFFLYVDEFQNFATESFATILSEARKYRLNLTMANQYIAQMPEEVRDAVFGNVGSLISFQVGFDDAEYLSQQLAEVVTPNDLVSLNKYTIYNRIMVEGMPSRPFSADTLSPPEMEGDKMGQREKIIRLSRERYSKSRVIVEDKIKRWSSNTGPKDLPEGKENQKLSHNKKPELKSKAKGDAIPKGNPKPKESSKPKKKN